MTSALENRVKIKICGLTNLEDAQVAVDAGADLLGFIFYEKSPRYVDPAVAADIVSAIKHAARSPILGFPILETGKSWETGEPRPPLCVGVFVNAAPDEISATLDRCGLDLAQLHGEEDPATLAALAGRAFKALRPRTAAEAEDAARRFAPVSQEIGPDILLDAYHPALRGGTGETGDWSLAAGLASRYRVLLAGGLTPGNVGDAIRQVAPWGVDVASGVEAAPGRKDHERVRKFVAAVRKCH